MPDEADDHVPDIDTTADPVVEPVAPEDPGATQEGGATEEGGADQETIPLDVVRSTAVPDGQADESQPPRAVLDPADAVFAEAVTGGLTWIPFAVYLGMWIVLAGLSAYLLYGASADQPARWMPAYVPLLWSGVALTALGPILSMAVWLVARSRRPKSGRRGLFASAMTRGALVAFFGVAIWVATLFVLELVAGGGAS